MSTIDIRCALSGRKLRPQNEYLMAPVEYSPVTDDRSRILYPPMKGEHIDQDVFEVAEEDREMAVWFLPHLPFDQWQFHTGSNGINPMYIGKPEFDVLPQLVMEWSDASIDTAISLAINNVKKEFLDQVTDKAKMRSFVFDKVSWDVPEQHEMALSVISHRALDGIMNHQYGFHHKLSDQISASVMFGSRAVCDLSPNLIEGIRRILVLRYAPHELRKLRAPEIFRDTYSLRNYEMDPEFDNLPAVLQFTRAITEFSFQRMEKDAEEFN